MKRSLLLSLLAYGCYNALVTPAETVCGDGLIELDEQCDGEDVGDESCETQGFDSGTLLCSSDCSTFDTSGCLSCGDGVIAKGEECDDGNTRSGDGCDATCIDELCGDGIVNDSQSEECDDGNAIAGDGCRQDCTLEVCGDAIQDPQEECQDQAPFSFSNACDAVCKTVIPEVEPNDSTASADVFPGPDFVVFGDMAPGDVDFFSLDLPQDGSLRIEQIEGGVEPCASSNGINAELALFDSSGTVLVAAGRSGRGECAMLQGTGSAPQNPGAGNLPPGLYSIRLRGDPNGLGIQTFRYALTISVR